MAATVAIPDVLIRSSKSPRFIEVISERRKWAQKYGRDDREPEDYELRLDSTSTDELRELAAIAESQKLKPAAATLNALIAARENKFDKVLPNFKPFEATLISFLQHEAADGWIYVRGKDGQVYPELVTGIRTTEPRDQKDSPSTIIETHSYTISENGRRDSAVGDRKNYYHFSPSDVVRKRVSDVLATAGIAHETPALRTAYDEEMSRFVRLVEQGFATQFVFEGVYLAADTRSGWRGLSEKPEHKRKVIHDLRADDYAARPSGHNSILFGDDAATVPEHPVVRVFDLSSHEFYWTHEAFLTPYVYDKSLREKIILPPSHRDLLDVMTTDLDAFLGDIIEGKSAGNIILCKGIPGVGKTLTAEVYSEVIEKPLYSIHSGALGTTASAIEEGLKTIFEHQKRWGCVLLLDEADVFVVQRGGNIEQNAIVAEFLRVLEYFDGLLFMTTNRPDDIDEAIISRCAAVIGYEVPDPENRAAVWRVLMTNYGVKIDAALIRKLVNVFPEITPRDTKMLLRLALRVAKFHSQPLTIDTFRQCAMFRAIKVAD